jgi:hypothetical protein
MIEVNEMRVILPALVEFTQNGEEHSVFVYLDHSKKDIVVPDASEIEDINEFKAAFAKYYNQKNPIAKQPVLPKDVFNKIDPTKFTEEKS